MPAISSYTAFLEEQIAQRTGLPVAIGSVAGEFSGFNPVLLLSDLQLAIDDSAESPALEFSEARIAVDMGRSIWQRRWVLDEFVIRNLRIDITESADGSWQLSGVATPGSNDPVDLNASIRHSCLSISSSCKVSLSMSILAMVTVSVLFRVQLPSAIRDKITTCTLTPALREP